MDSLFRFLPGWGWLGVCEFACHNRSARKIVILILLCNEWVGSKNTFQLVDETYFTGMKYRNLRVPKLALHLK